MQCCSERIQCIIHLGTVAVELLTSPHRRGRFLPDPRYDAVRCIALAVQDDGEDVPDGHFAARVLLSCGEGAGARPQDGLHGVQVTPQRRHAGRGTAARQFRLAADGSPQSLLRILDCG